ncbi:YesL family protein [Alteribacter populi]|uniref:YesL family protein n=1 Tax=Alteribacter populi TaxID=2011011 RepID=UPI000BBB6274|nr:DUF624 domain-containing protein [Alteribacter populi]
MVVEKLENLFRVISKFALLNMMWLGFTVLGFGVIGFFPATVAMFSVSRQWVRGEQNIPIFKTFVTCFKQNVMKANLYGWATAFIGMVLFVNYQAITMSGAEVPLFIVISFILLVIFYLLMAVSAIPVSIHFEGNSFDLIRKTTLFVMGRFHIALLFLVLVWASAHVSLAFPTVILFFSGSVLSYILMWFFTRTLEKIEHKHAKQSFS